MGAESRQELETELKTQLLICADDLQHAAMLLGCTLGWH